MLRVEKVAAVEEEEEGQDTETADSRLPISSDQSCFVLCLIQISLLHLLSCSFDIMFYCFIFML